MTTKANPLSGAMPEKKDSMASNPPAEAPTATYREGTAEAGAGVNFPERFFLDGVECFLGMS